MRWSQPRSHVHHPPQEAAFSRELPQYSTASPQGAATVGGSGPISLVLTTAQNRDFPVVGKDGEAIHSRSTSWQQPHAGATFYILTTSYCRVLHMYHLILFILPYALDYLRTRYSLVYLLTTYMLAMYRPPHSNLHTAYSFASSYISPKYRLR